MLFSYNWLQSYFQKKLPKPEKLAELLTMHFAEVEDIKKSGNDYALDIDIRPNRTSDCLSHDGVAREIAAILNYDLKIKKPELKEDKTAKVKDFVSVQVQDRAACPRYTARVATGVKIGPSPKWLQDRLRICGLRPINNIVDATNYVMLKTGQPLHAFDMERLQGKKIIVRFAANKEKITTLDGENFNLDSGILVIADGAKPVAIAGIKGGKSTEISKTTKTVVIESANFNQSLIRGDSQKINLKTDASLRFEHGLDPNLTELAINQTAVLIQKTAGGRIASGLIDLYPQKFLPIKISLDLNYVSSLLGAEIPEKETKMILERLGFRVVKSRETNANILLVEVPTRRLDVLLPEDLIEEIGRIYSYGKIPSVFPLASLISPERNFDIFWEEAAKNFLKEAGLTEVYNYSFLGEKEISAFGWPSGKLIKLKNPLSADYKYLRPSLIPGLMKTVQKNQENFPEIKTFELGKAFEAPKKERKILTGLITGEAFYSAKGIIDLLFNKMGISSVWYDEYRTSRQEKEIAWWHPKKCAEIKSDGERIGFLGEISSQILEQFKIKSKVVYFDIFFDKLIQLASEEQEYRPISRFPAAVRDVAVLVSGETRVEEVLNEIETAGGTLVRDVDLFDIYDGEELPEGKKNMAFHIIFQAEDRTLSSQEIDQAYNKIMKALERNPEWQIRK